MKKEVVKKGKWMLAYFEKDTPFVGFGVKGERYSMLIHGGTMTKVMVSKEETNEKESNKEKSNKK